MKPPRAKHHQQVHDHERSQLDVKWNVGWRFGFNESIKVIEGDFVCNRFIDTAEPTGCEYSNDYKANDQRFASALKSHGKATL